RNDKRGNFDPYRWAQGPCESPREIKTRHIRRRRSYDGASPQLCVVGPKYHSPALPAPPQYKENSNWRVAQPNDQTLRGNWWEMFEDPRLNSLEEQINSANQTLKIAQAQFMQARALVRYYRADYIPTVTAGFSATRTRISSNVAGA